MSPVLVRGDSQNNAGKEKREKKKDRGRRTRVMFTENEEPVQERCPQHSRTRTARITQGREKEKAEGDEH